VVILSKHRVKETDGAARSFITMVFDVIGLLVMQGQAGIHLALNDLPLKRNERINGYIGPGIDPVHFPLV